MYKIPFYSNTRDNTHCVQACLKSTLKFYFPQKDYSFAYLDRVTAHKKGLWTWDFALLLFFAKLKFETIQISDFSLKRFSQEGESFLKKIWDKEVYETQKRYSDFGAEQKLAKKVMQEKRIKLLKRPANLKDIRSFFRDGFVLIVPINPFTLEGKKIYSSHIVVITDIDKKEITFHDPGLPPQKNRKVPVSLFLKAMQDPDKKSASIIATRLL